MGVDLREFDETYEDVEPPDKASYEEVPDGVYQVRVEKIELKYSKVREEGGGNPMLRWTLRVLTPAFEGALIFRQNMIVTEDNIRYLKGDLITCGLKLQKLSHLPARLDELLDIELEVKKVTNASRSGTFSNVYINRRIETQAPRRLPGQPGKKGPDGLPF